jgi:hypothetical protein
MTDLIERLREYHDNFDGRDTTLEDAIAEIERLRKAMSDAIREASQPHYGEKYIQIDNYDDAILILEKALEGK